MSIYYATHYNESNNVAVHEDLSLKIRLIFLATVTLITTYLPSYIEKTQGIDIPNILEFIIILFIFAGGYLSQQFDLFLRFFWWDDLLHFTSGLFVSVVGFLLIYKLNYGYNLDLNPWLIAIFTFTFSITVAVFWEIAEFIADACFQSNLQKWNVPADTPLLGKPYQGLALRDTMADLIIASLGALIMSGIAYFLVNTKKEETLQEINKFMQQKDKDKDKDKEDRES
jgi:hypothetical protein